MWECELDYYRMDVAIHSTEGQWLTEWKSGLQKHFKFIFIFIYHLYSFVSFIFIFIHHLSSVILAYKLNTSWAYMPLYTCLNTDADVPPGMRGNFMNNRNRYKQIVYKFA